MIPTSPAEFAASNDRRLPVTEQVGEYTWTLPQPVPAGTVPYTLGYLVKDSRNGIHVIDPGWGSDENWARLEEALTGLGAQPGDVASILITHLHPDHLGLAERLREQSTGAPVVLHRAEQAAADALVASASDRVRTQVQLSEEWGVPADRRPELERVARRSDTLKPFTADLLVEHDEELDIPGRRIRARHTPGHTPGHICLDDRSQRHLFTGDHVLPTVFPGIGLGGPTTTNPIDDYLNSLDAVLEYDDYADTLPGHGYRFRGIAERCRDMRAHHLRRASQVEAALDAHPDADIWAVASSITWSAGWAKLHDFLLFSALAQTAMHVDRLRRPR